MDYKQTDLVVIWTKKKRGRLTALGSALGFDRRTMHERLISYRTVSIDFEVVLFHQQIIEAKEKQSVQLLAELKIWLSHRDNRKKALALELGASNASVSKWFNADVDDTCLMNWIQPIQAAMPAIEQKERNNFAENRRIANRLIKHYNAASKHKPEQLAELAHALLDYSNTEKKTATVFFSKSRVVAAGWMINSLSIGFEHGKNGNQADETVSSVEICILNLPKNKHFDIDTAIFIGEPDQRDIKLLISIKPKILFHETENENFLKLLREQNITVCPLKQGGVSK